MKNQQLEQQVENLQKDVVDLRQRIAMKDVIFSYTDEKYYGATPQNFTIKLIELLRDRYVENTNVWKIVIRDVGSAYARAFEGFNRIVDIRNLEIRARRQMIANILGVFAGAGLCWISPTLHQWKRIDQILTTEGAKNLLFRRVSGSGQAKWNLSDKGP